MALTIIITDAEADQEIAVSVETFRRILNAAHFSLSKLRQVEGANFPEVDRRALLTVVSAIQTYTGV